VKEVKTTIVPQSVTSSDVSIGDPALLAVLNGGYCIGCGACAAVAPGVQMRLNEYGQYVAQMADARELGRTPMKPSSVCPFADGNPDEDQLSESLFGPCDAVHPTVGRALAAYAGSVTDQSFRAKTTSGGVASWFLASLLERRIVDHVLHVGACDVDRAGPPLFAYHVSSTPQEVLQRAKSRYYPIEMSGVLSHVMTTPGRYALVGLPCFVKAVRLSALQSATIRDRIVITLGLVCGHLKSTAFADMLAWQCGVEPPHLRRIDFRTKQSGAPANHYAVTVESDEPGKQAVTRPVAGLFGTDWGMGFFKPRACDFCDDVVGETADISVGDAWLPEYTNDPAGTSIVVVRHPRAQALIESGIEAGELSLDRITLDDVAKSQEGGIRHRRVGLAYRLAEAEARGLATPRKRVKPDRSHLTRRQQSVFRLRQQLSELSHVAFQRAVHVGDFAVFRKEMRPLVRRYKAASRGWFLVRVLRRLMSIVKKRL